MLWEEVRLVNNILKIVAGRHPAALCIIPVERTRNFPFPLAFLFSRHEAGRITPPRPSQRSAGVKRNSEGYLYPPPTALTSVKPGKAPWIPIMHFSLSSKFLDTYCSCSSRSKQSPKAESQHHFLFSPPKRLPLLNCLLSFHSWGMVGKRVAGFQTLASHELNSGRKWQPSIRKCLSETRVSLTGIRHFDQDWANQNLLWKQKFCKKTAPPTAQRRARAHLCKCVRCHMHACSPTPWWVWTETRPTGSLLSSYLATNQLTWGQWWADQCSPCAPPQRPCAHPWPLRRGMILPLSAAVWISSPDNTLSTTVVLNVYSTNFPRHRA